MRYSILISILFIGFSFEIFAQEFEKDTNDFFFSTSFDSLGNCYGKSIIQPQLDTVEKEIILEEETHRLIPVEKFIYEEKETDFYFMNRGNKNLGLILPYVDTTIHMIKIAEAEWVLEPIPGDLRETVTEQFLVSPEHHRFRLVGRDKTNSRSWHKTEVFPIYSSIQKKRLVSPWDPRMNEIPAQYITVIAITPKQDILPHQMNMIKSLCKKSYTIKSKFKTTKEVIDPPIKRSMTTYSIKQEAKIINVEIPCTIDTALLKKIQKKLNLPDHHKTTEQGDLDKNTRRAIIDYQIKNKLPIGQLDKETLSNLLE